MSGESPISSDDLEERLRGATTWEGPDPEIWAKALGASSRNRWRFERAAGMFVQAMRRPMGIAAAVLLIGVCGVILLALNAPVARRGPSGAAATSFQSGDDRNSLAQVMDPSRDGKSREVIDGFPPASPSPSTLLDQRVVIRNATIDIETKDVRGAFARVALLISDATGEYVQASSLTGGNGEGAARQPLYGQLTLRIGVYRLSEVLNRLRELGTVVAESSGGEDVTSQYVDLDARLRNEQRVETELLGLLTSRQDAPLGELLELREQISRVREQIEQLTAQRERLSHLASLATVLVTVREPDAAYAATRGDSIGSYFTSRLAAAWRNGLFSLSDSLGWLVGVLIGGAFWWALIFIGVIILVRTLRRSAPKR